MAEMPKGFYSADELIDQYEAIGNLGVSDEPDKEVQQLLSAFASGEITQRTSDGFHSDMFTAGKKSLQSSLSYFKAAKEDAFGDPKKAALYSDTASRLEASAQRLREANNILSFGELTSTANPIEWAKYFYGTAVEMTPHLATTLGAGLGTGLAAKGVQKLAANRVKKLASDKFVKYSAGLGALANEYATLSGEMYGFSGNSEASLALGAPAAALNVVAPVVVGNALWKNTKGIGKNQARSYFQTVVKDAIGKSALIEGGTEYLQSELSILAKDLEDPNFDATGAEANMYRLQAAVTGAVVGPIYSFGPANVSHFLGKGSDKAATFVEERRAKKKQAAINGTLDPDTVASFTAWIDSKSFDEEVDKQIAGATANNLSNNKSLTDEQAKVFEGFLSDSDSSFDAILNSAVKEAGESEGKEGLFNTEAMFEKRKNELSKMPIANLKDLLPKGDSGRRYQRRDTLASYILNREFGRNQSRSMDRDRTWELKMPVGDDSLAKLVQKFQPEDETNVDTSNLQINEDGDLINNDGEDVYPLNEQNQRVTIIGTNDQEFIGDNSFRKSGKNDKGVEYTAEGNAIKKRDKLVNQLVEQARKNVLVADIISWANESVPDFDARGFIAQKQGNLDLLIDKYWDGKFSVIGAKSRVDESRNLTPEQRKAVNAVKKAGDDVAKADRESINAAFLNTSNKPSASPLSLEQQIERDIFGKDVKSDAQVEAESNLTNTADYNEDITRGQVLRQSIEDAVTVRKVSDIVDASSAEGRLYDEQFAQGEVDQDGYVIEGRGVDFESPRQRTVINASRSYTGPNGQKIDRKSAIKLNQILKNTKSMSLEQAIKAVGSTANEYKRMLQYHAGFVNKTDGTVKILNLKSLALDERHRLKTESKQEEALGKIEALHPVNMTTQQWFTYMLANAVSGLNEAGWRPVSPSEAAATGMDISLEAEQRSGSKSRFIINPAKRVDKGPIANRGSRLGVENMFGKKSISPEMEDQVFVDDNDQNTSTVDSLTANDAIYGPASSRKQTNQLNRQGPQKTFEVERQDGTKTTVTQDVNEADRLQSDKTQARLNLGIIRTVDEVVNTSQIPDYKKTAALEAGNSNEPVPEMTASNVININTNKQIKFFVDEDGNPGQGVLDRDTGEITTIGDTPLFEVGTPLREAISKDDFGIRQGEAYQARRKNFDSYDQIADGKEIQNVTKKQGGVKLVLGPSDSKVELFVQSILSRAKSILNPMNRNIVIVDKAGLKKAIARAPTNRDFLRLLKDLDRKLERGRNITGETFVNTNMDYTFIYLDMSPYSLNPKPSPPNYALMQTAKEKNMARKQYQKELNAFRNFKNDISPNAKARVAYDLYHELGHHVFQHFRNATPEIKQEIFNLYQNSPEKEWYENAFSNNKALAVDEWFADRIAASTIQSFNIESKVHYSLKTTTPPSEINSELKAIIGPITKALQSLWKAWTETYNSIVGNNKKNYVIVNGKQIPYIKGQRNRPYHESIMFTDWVLSALDRGMLGKTFQTRINERSHKEATAKSMEQGLLQPRNIQRYKTMFDAFRKGGFMTLFNRLAATSYHTLSEFGPKGEKIAEMLYTQVGEKALNKKAQGGFLNKVDSSRGKFFGRLEEALGTFDRVEQAKILDDFFVWREGDRANTPRRPQFRKLEKLFDSLGLYITGSKIPDVFIRENYIPHMYSPEKLNTQEVFDSLVELLLRKEPTFKNQRKLAEEAVTNLTQRVITREDRAKGEGDALFTAQNMKDRIWDNITYGELYAAGAVYSGMDSAVKYIEDVTRTVEFNNIFGDTVEVDNPKYNASSLGNMGQKPRFGKPNRIREPAKILKYKSNARLDAAIADLPLEQQENAQYIVDSMLGRLGKKISPTMNAVSNWIMTIAAMAVLPLAIIPSVVDTMMPWVRSREFSEGVRNIAYIIEAAKETNLPFTEDKKQPLRELAASLGTISSEAVNGAMANVYTSSYMKGSAKKTSDWFFKTIGLEALTRFSRTVSTGFGKDWIIKHAYNIKNGSENKNASRSRRYLESVGVNNFMDVINWAEGDRNFESREGQIVGTAIYNFVNQAQLRPNAAERPVFANDPRFQILYQLSTFYYSFGQKVIGGVAKEFSARGKEGSSSLEQLMPAVVVGAALLPLSAMAMAFREEIKYEDEDSPVSDRSYAGWTADVISQAGFLGPFEQVLSIWNSDEYGLPFWAAPLGPSVGLAVQAAGDPGFSGMKDLVPFSAALKAAGAI